MTLSRHEAGAHQVDPEVDLAMYHCMTRVVNKVRLFDDSA
jgi:hypothetical protein